MIIEVRVGIIMTTDGIVNKPLDPKHALEVIQAYKLIDTEIDPDSSLVKKLELIIKALADD